MQIDVETAAVTAGRITARIRATGTLQAVATVDVAAPVSGNVTALAADDFSVVHKGDVLARLDPAPYEERLKVARDALQAVKLGEAPGKSLADAEAELESAVADLDRTVIRSPVDGVIVVRNVDVGELVTSGPSAPVVYRIGVDLDQLQLLVDANPVDVADVKAGDEATFTVGADNNRFQATITKVGNSILATVADPGHRLRPGLTVAVTFAEATRDDAIRIPDEALQFEPPPEAQALVDDRGLLVSVEGEPIEEGVHEVWRFERGKLTPVAVRIGLHGNGWTELTGGSLRPGDELATSVSARRSYHATWLP